MKICWYFVVKLTVHTGEFFPDGPYLQSMMGFMCLYVCIHEDWEKVAFCVLCFKCVLSLCYQVQQRGNILSELTVADIKVS